MSTTASSQIQIVKLCQAMFNAAPGAVYLNTFSQYLTTNNASMNDLANALAGSSAFTQSSLYPSTLTNTEFAARFVTNVVGATVSEATQSAAVVVLANMLDAGQTRGEVMLWAVESLSAAIDNADWGVAAAQFNNQVEVGTYYSVDRAGSALTLATLQAVTANVTHTAASLAAGKAVFDTAVTGTVADGYISGANIFADLNGDGMQNTGEASTTTDAFGNFTLPAGTFGTLIASGGTDISTNLAFTGSFSAPAGATVVNPLTTLVQSMVDSGSTPDEAQSQVLTALGLPTTTNLSTFDAIAVALGGGSTEEKTAAAQVQAASAQVANILVQGAAVLQGASSTTTTAAAMASVVTALASNFAAASTTVDLTQTTVLQSVMNEAAAATSTEAATAVTASLTNITTVMASANTSINTAMTANPTDFTAALSQIAKVQVVAQGEAATSMQTGMAAGDLTNTVSGFTGTALDTAVTAAVAGSLTENVEATVGTPVTPVVTPPVGGGGGGDAPPAATFTVTDSGGGAYVLSTGNGNVVVTVDGANYVFTPTTGTAVSVATAGVNSIVVNTITLTGTAAHLTGETITGTGTVAITALNSTVTANLSLISTTTVTANAAGNMTFTGSLGKAAVTVASGTLNVDSATIGTTATFSVGSGATLQGSAANLSGKTVTGAGNVTVTALAADTDLANIDNSGTLSASVTSSLNLSAVDLSNVDSLTVGSDGGTEVNVTVSAAQLTALSGKTTIGNNDSLTADTMAPTFTAQAATVGTKTVTLTASETVSGTPAAGDFAVIMSNSANAVTAVAVNGTTVTLTLTNNIINNATLTVDYTQGTNKITDATGNALVSVGDPLAVAVTSDITPPTISGVSSTATDGAYNVGDVIAVTVQFSEAVTVTGTPQLTLETGTTDRVVNYASGSGTNTLTFSYTVQSGDTTAHLDYTNTTALALNSGTIKDAAGNNATLTLATPGATGSLGNTKNLVVDGVAPTFTAQAATAGTKTVTLTAIEAVSGTPAAGDFAVVMNGSANAVTAVDVNGTSVTLTLTSAIANSATLTVDYTQGTNKIADTAGNALTSVGDPLTVTVTNDAIVPTVSGVSSTTIDGAYNVGDVIAVTVQFSEAVTVTGTPQLTLETGTTDRVVNYASGSGTNTLTFSYTVQSGDTSADLSYTNTTALALNSGTIKDAAGNSATLTLATPGQANSLSANKALVVDGVVPTFTAQAATAGTKTVTLTASEAVSGTPAVGDFAVAMNGSANAVTAVDVNGTSVTLTLTSAIANSATLTVDYTQGTNKIADTAGNALISVGDPLTVTVTNDAIVPTVSGVSSTAIDGAYNVGDVIAVTVQFSEAVTVTGTPQLTLETGTTDRVVNYASGSGTNTLTFSYTVQSGDTSADLSYTSTTALALNGGTIKDAAGNSATLTLATPGQANSLSANKALVVDGVMPTILTTGGSTSPADGETLMKSAGIFANITLDFSETIQAVSGVTLTNNIQIHAPTGSGDQLIGFDASIGDGNLLIDLNENDADITGIENQPIYLTIAGNTLQDTAGNLLAGVSNTTDYNLFLGYI